jgi:hypothetical protein
VKSLRPASGQDRGIRLDVQPSQRDRVVVTLHIRDQAGRDRSLELVLTSLEARKLGHMLLDGANPSRKASNDD